MVGVMRVDSDMMIGGLSAIVRIVRIIPFPISTARENCDNSPHQYNQHNRYHAYNVKKRDVRGIGIAHSTRTTRFPECRGISGTIQPIGADGAIGIISTFSLV